MALAGVMMIALTACTQEKLCENEHPHMSKVSFSYDWSTVKSYTNQLPDSMLILVDKVVYQHMNTLAYDTKTLSGKYLSEMPDTMQRLKDSLGIDINHDLTEFDIRSGEYKFLTMNLSARNFDYSELESVLRNNDVQAINKVNITYKTYNATSEYIGIGALNVSDGNNYVHANGDKALYIIDDRTPVAIDSVAIQKWEQYEKKTVGFKPTPITHNIDLFFDINKDIHDVNFFIESVYVILSGIPHKVNLSSGALDISNTDKMFFKTQFVNPGVVPYDGVKAISDTPSNKKVRCYKNLTVTGIVENEFTDRDSYYGPGTMQVVINTKVLDGGVYIPKTINAMVNIHKSLQNAKLQIYDYERDTYRKSREHSDLYISLDVTLDKAALIGDGDGGLVKWKEADVPGQYNIY